MRHNNLSKKHYLKDFHLRTAHNENWNKSILFLNVRLYQLNFRLNRDIYLYHDVNINRIYRSLRGYEYLEINQDYYSVETIRKTLGAIYRSRCRVSKVSVSDSHPYLCFLIDHAVLMIQKEKKDRSDSDLIYSLIKE